MEFETRGRSEERAHFLRPLKRMEDIENRFELTEKSGFEGNAKLFFAGQRKRGDPCSNRKFVSRFASRLASSTDNEKGVGAELGWKKD